MDRYWYQCLSLCLSLHMSDHIQCILYISCESWFVCHSKSPKICISMYFIARILDQPYTCMYPGQWECEPYRLTNLKLEHFIVEYNMIKLLIRVPHVPATVKHWMLVNVSKVGAAQWLSAGRSSKLSALTGASVVQAVGASNRQGTRQNIWGYMYIRYIYICKYRHNLT
jgi:hypothetical protein